MNPHKNPRITPVFAVNEFKIKLATFHVKFARSFYKKFFCDRQDFLNNKVENKIKNKIEEIFYFFKNSCLSLDYGSDMEFKSTSPISPSETFDVYDDFTSLKSELGELVHPSFLNDDENDDEKKTIGFSHSPYSKLFLVKHLYPLHFTKKECEFLAKIVLMKSVKPTYSKSDIPNKLGFSLDEIVFIHKKLNSFQDVISSLMPEDSDVITNINASICVKVFNLRPKISLSLYKQFASNHETPFGELG